MKSYVLMVVCLLGGAAASRAGGQEVTWRPRSQDVPPATFPLAAGCPARLGAPVPLGDAAPPRASVTMTDAEVRPASFSTTTAGPAAPVARGKFFQEIPSRLMVNPGPVGPASLPALPDPLATLPQPQGVQPCPPAAQPKTLDAKDGPGCPAHGCAAPGCPTGAACPRCDDPGFSFSWSNGQEAIMFWEEIGGGSERFYVRGEYLLWWLRGQSLPPLISTSPATVPQGVQGALGPNTTVLFGGQQESQAFSGGRLTAGWWIDPCQRWGIEGSYFQLARRSNTFTADSGTTPVIARPFFNQNDGIEDRELVASPGLNGPPGTEIGLNGRLSVTTFTEFWGAEANARYKWLCGCDYRVDLLAGYRYLELREGLSFAENITIANLPFPVVTANPVAVLGNGDQFIAGESFNTRNRFHGGQVGVNAELRRGRWIFEGTAKVALGVVQQSLDIQGSTTLVQTNGNRITAPGNLFAQPSNIGSYNRDRFAVAPEVGIRVGYKVTDQLHAFVGYNFLYLSSVLRPGDQIDRVIDIRQPPFGVAQGQVVNPVNGPSRPLVPFRETDFWAHGVSFGLEYRY